MSHNQFDSATAVIATTLINSLLKQLPSQQEKRGDRKLELARALAIEFESLISEEDRRVIEDKITFAREVREELDSKSGFSKMLHAREFRKAAREAYRYTKGASERARDAAAFSHSLAIPLSTPSTPEVTSDSFDCVLRVAQSLYQCYLSCKEAFPSPHLRQEWVAAAWSEACSRTGIYPVRLPYGKELACCNMHHITNIKAKIMHHVESLYRFDTSQAPDSISRNTRDAQALLNKVAFIYQEPISGGTPHHPYRHPMIQKAINITWFQNKDADGIVYPEHFTPMPIQAISLALTVIECCINEWTDGTRRDSNWDEERYKTVYFSHISSLNDLRDHGQPQGEDLLAYIQLGLLKNARVHAGAPPEPVTGAGRLLPQDLDVAIREDLPAYVDNDSEIPMIVVSDES